MAELASAPRPSSFEGPYGHSYIISAVKDLLYDCRFSRSGMFPIEIARRCGCTRIEARLALLVWLYEKFLIQRRDGRWCYDINEPWRHA